MVWKDVQIVHHSPRRRLPLQRGPDSLYAAIEWNANDECDVEPIDVLVPIGFGNGRVCDVWLPRVIASASVWF